MICGTCYHWDLLNVLNLKNMFLLSYDEMAKNTAKGRKMNCTTTTKSFSTIDQTVSREPFS